MHQRVATVPNRGACGFLKIVKKEKGGRRGRGKKKEELGEGGEEEVGAEELEEDRKNFSVTKCCPRYLRLPSL